MDIINMSSAAALTVSRLLACCWITLELRTGFSDLQPAVIQRTHRHQTDPTHHQINAFVGHDVTDIKQITDSLIYSAWFQDGTSVNQIFIDDSRGCWRQKPKKKNRFYLQKRIRSGFRASGSGAARSRCLLFGGFICVSSACFRMAAWAYSPSVTTAAIFD